nr:hypothetical protein [Aurantimonas marina]
MFKPPGPVFRGATACTAFIASSSMSGGRGRRGSLRRRITNRDADRRVVNRKTRLGKQRLQPLGVVFQAKRRLGLARDQMDRQLPVHQPHCDIKLAELLRLQLNLDRLQRSAASAQMQSSIVRDGSGSRPNIRQGTGDGGGDLTSRPSACRRIVGDRRIDLRILDSPCPVNVGHLAIRRIPVASSGDLGVSFAYSCAGCIATSHRNGVVLAVRLTGSFAGSLGPVSALHVNLRIGRCQKTPETGCRKGWADRAHLTVERDRIGRLKIGAHRDEVDPRRVRAAIDAPTERLYCHFGLLRNHEGFGDKIWSV